MANTWCDRCTSRSIQIVLCWHVATLGCAGSTVEDVGTILAEETTTDVLEGGDEATPVDVPGAIDAATPSDLPPGSDPTPCAPDCEGKECGANGCGGVCGICARGEICGGGQCVGCAPECLGKGCGDDGCGGLCGSCAEGEICDDGQCTSSATDCCQPHSESGCPSSAECETCVCTLDSVCCTWPWDGICAGKAQLFCATECGCVSCSPACAGVQCGDDGCGGSCGSCLDSEACVASLCVPVCQPECASKACGSDGCGGTCGSCAAGDSCEDGACIPSCLPACSGKACGDDGCGGECGTCAPSEVCQDGQCTPQGADCCSVQAGAGCPSNGVCEACVCGADSVCCDSGWDAICAEEAVDLCAAACGCAACAPGCEGKACGDDGCGGACGECALGETCQEGACIAASVGSGACCAALADPGCASDQACESCTCDVDAFCCDVAWDDLCAVEADELCAVACGCGCEPSCDGKSCGDDGCGGLCGECAGDLACIDGICSDVGGACCVALDNAGCATDLGCNGCVCDLDPYCCDVSWDDLCGLQAGELCTTACGCTNVCLSDCDGRTCGDDGCGASCGTCDETLECINGACVDPSGLCAPCLVEPCGGDNICLEWLDFPAVTFCATSCEVDECPEDFFCDEVDGSYLCVPGAVTRCVGDDVWLGDACGNALELLATCGEDELCDEGTCWIACTPSTCEALGKQCGEWPDDCGGFLSCGGCSGGSTCVEGECHVSTGVCAVCGAETPCEDGLGCLSWADFPETTFCAAPCDLDSCPDGFTCEATDDSAVCAPDWDVGCFDDSVWLKDACGNLLEELLPCEYGELCVQGECQEACAKYTCDELGKLCGAWPDGCGGTVVCSQCAQGEVCINGACAMTQGACTPCSEKVPCQDGLSCVAWKSNPKDTFCASTCGPTDDCGAGFSCEDVGGKTACMPERTTACKGNEIWQRDGCGNWLAKLDTCGKAATCEDAHCVASCQPETCSSLEKDCGAWDNACGGTLVCGGCKPDSTCINGQCLPSIGLCLPCEDEDNPCAEGLVCATYSDHPWVSVCVKDCADTLCPPGFTCEDTAGSLLCMPELLPACFGQDAWLVDACGNELSLTAACEAPFQACDHGACEEVCFASDCDDLGVECGAWPDGCGGTVLCGVCDAGSGCQQGQCVEAAPLCGPCGDAIPCDGGLTCMTWQSYPGVSFCAQRCDAPDAVCPKDTKCKETEQGNVCTPVWKTVCKEDDVWREDACGNALESIETCGPTAPCTKGACQATCTPATCDAMGVSCGTWPDGCGALLSCGSCADGATCQGGQCVAPSEACAPCNDATPCGEGLSCHQWAAFPKVSFCLASCASTPCPAGFTCEPAGEGKQCFPEQSAACKSGEPWLVDACGNALVRIASCGAAEACVSGACQALCTPVTCASLGKECGEWSNGCGVAIVCGGCDGDAACSEGQCVPSAPANGGGGAGMCQPCTSDASCQGTLSCLPYGTYPGVSVCAASCESDACPASFDCKDLGSKGHVCVSQLSKSCIGQEVWAVDGCGNALKALAACAAGQVCSAGECKTPCAPTTCGAIGKACGTWPDGCGGSLLCAACADDQVCQNGACVVPGGPCSPCGPSKPCAGDLTCESSAESPALTWCATACDDGECGEGFTCDGSTCVPDVRYVCKEGDIWKQDTCGNTLGKVTPCQADEKCVDGACVVVCKPATCASLNRTCGIAADGCGATMDCGLCGDADVCQAGSCVPASQHCQACDGGAAPCAAGLVCRHSNVDPAVTYCTETCELAPCTKGFSCEETAGGKVCTPDVTDACQGSEVWKQDACGHNLVKAAICGESEACVKGLCLATCTPATCATLGKACGTWDDGCGAKLGCGTCGEAQICHNGQCLTPSTACQACEGGANPCAPGLSCRHWKTYPGVSFCVEPCQGSTCPTGFTCKDSGGKPWCLPDHTVACKGAEVWKQDACGNDLTKVQVCASDQVCEAAACKTVCKPATCQGLGKTCGSASDGCGGTLSCGVCGSGKVCKGGTCLQTASACAPCEGSGSAPCGDGLVCRHWNKYPSVSFCAASCDAAPCQKGFTCTPSGDLKLCIPDQTVVCNGSEVARQDACGNVLQTLATCATDQKCEAGACKSTCQPNTCALLGKTCGVWNDGCGGKVTCPACPAGHACFNGQCGVPSKECGACEGGANPCGEGLVCQHWSDYPSVSFCVHDCATASCPTGFSCALTSDGKLCLPDQAPVCQGSEVWVKDGCGHLLAKQKECAASETCESGACKSTCAPSTCAGLGKTCGSYGDGCGGKLVCGTCAASQICLDGTCVGGQPACGACSDKAPCQPGMTCLGWKSYPGVKYCADDCTTKPCPAGTECATNPANPAAKACIPKVSVVCQGSEVWKQDACGNALAKIKACSSTEQCKDGACVPVCAAATCASLGKACGSWSDGCGASLQCGTCSGSDVCQDGKCITPASVCSPCGAAAAPCAAGLSCRHWSDFPKVSFCVDFCDAASCATGFNCVQAGDQKVCIPVQSQQCEGSDVWLKDACGNLLAKAQSCAEDQVCTGAKCVTPCKPATCTTLGKSCGSYANGCGGTADCGDCDAGLVCAKGQCVAGKPACAQCSDDAPCQAGLDCLSYSAYPAVTYCAESCEAASCPAGTTCTDFGQKKRCVPDWTGVCQGNEVWKQDTCGNALYKIQDCGANAQCTDGACVPTCVPTSCETQGKQCGEAADGCGKILTCGVCSNGQVCQSGKCLTPAGVCAACSKDVPCAAGLSCRTWTAWPSVSFCAAGCDAAPCPSGFSCTSAGVGKACIPVLSNVCKGSEVWKQDSCGNALEKVEACGTGTQCKDGACQLICQPKSCKALGASCGSHPDGCGGKAECGTCDTGAVCDQGQCKSFAASCGKCQGAGGKPCGAGLVCQHWLAYPEVSFCATTCANASCPSGFTCADVSGAGKLCLPKQVTVCKGSEVWLQDACGNALKKSDVCDSNEKCASGVCKPVCVPKTCADLGKGCGSWKDGCGGTVACGACAADTSCQNGECLPGNGACAPCPDGACPGDLSCRTWNKFPKVSFCVEGCTAGSCPAGFDCQDTDAGKRCMPSWKTACKGPEIWQRDACGNDLFKIKTCGDGSTCKNGACAEVPVCQTCASLKRECGTVSNGCGQLLTCGTCDGGDVCTAGGTCECVPKTCTSAGAACGKIDDGCGHTLQCGSCTSPKQCTAQHTCVCQASCAGKQCGQDACGSSCGTCAAGKACTSGQCVDSGPEKPKADCAGKQCGDDGVGGSCGTCPASTACSGGKCVCEKKSCADLGVGCGQASDGCGGTLSCGACPSGKTCTDHQCVCKGKSCGDLGVKCGNVDDGCGAKTWCGGCPEGATCQAGSCSTSKKSCQDLGRTCGKADDGQGGPLDCGTCPAGQTCAPEGKCACAVALCNGACCPPGQGCQAGKCAAACQDGDGDQHFKLDAKLCPTGDDYCDANPNNWTQKGCTYCVDKDKDGRGASCDKGADCNDKDAAVFEGCAGCVDNDKDGFTGFDPTACPSGSDYNDASAICHTKLGCSCTDADGDGYGSGCDLGEDCDDNNPAIHDGCCVDRDGDGHFEKKSCTTGDDFCDDVKDYFKETDCECLVDHDDDGYLPFKTKKCPKGQDFCDNPAMPGHRYAWTEKQCNTCKDADGDGYFAVCDDKTHPRASDCDDNNPKVHDNCGCPFGPKWPIPGTGLKRCYSTETYNKAVTADGVFSWHGIILVPDEKCVWGTEPQCVAGCPKEGEAYFGQDGNYPDQSLKLTKDDNVVNDATTKLTWEVGTLKLHTFDEARKYCAELKNPESGWRLPDVFELHSIVDYGYRLGESGKIYEKPGGGTWDPKIFLANGDQEYWSASRRAGDYYPWCVNFQNGSVLPQSPSAKKHVRCVKGLAPSGTEPGASPRAFTTTAGKPHVVIDATTSLMWEAHTEDHNLLGFGLWKHALSYCEKLQLDGFSDWRLPSIKELFTLVHTTRDSKQFHGVLPPQFTGTSKNNFVSGTTFGPTNDREAMSVNFETGGVSSVTKLKFTQQVRCVRTDTTSTPPPPPPGCSAACVPSKNLAEANFKDLFPAGAFTKGPKPQKLVGAPDPLTGPDKTLEHVLTAKLGWPDVKETYAAGVPGTPPECKAGYELTFPMCALTHHRKHALVNPLLDDLIAAQKDASGVLLVRWEPTGSDRPTSDYDINVYDTGTWSGSPAKVVRAFNDAFRKEAAKVAAGLTCESGTELDTNVYDKGDTLPTKGIVVDPALVRAKLEIAEKNDEIQDVAALAKIRRYMDAATWGTYCAKAQATVSDNPANPARKVLKERQDLASQYWKNASVDIEAKKKTLGLGYTPSDLELHASNELYADKLDALQAKRAEQKTALDALNAARAWTMKDPKTRAKKIRDAEPPLQQATFQVKQAAIDALLFANEAYNSEGAILDVVGNQGGLIVKAGGVPHVLRPQEELSSFNEQFGDALKDLVHYGYDPVKCGIQVSKYVERFIKVGLSIVNRYPSHPMYKEVQPVLDAMLEANAALVKKRADPNHPIVAEVNIVQVAGALSATAYAEKLTRLNILVNAIARGCP